MSCVKSNVPRLVSVGTYSNEVPSDRPAEEGAGWMEDTSERASFSGRRGAEEEREVRRWRRSPNGRASSNRFGVSGAVNLRMGALANAPVLALRHSRPPPDLRGQHLTMTLSSLVMMSLTFGGRPMM